MPQFQLYFTGSAPRPAGRGAHGDGSLLVVVRIAGVRGLGHDVLEHLAHRNVEVDALRRHGTQEPLRVDRVDLARLVDLRHRVVDDLLEGRVVTAQHHAVRLDGQRTGGA